MSLSPTTRTQTERSDQTRARILEAAIRQFAENGLSGARTDQIAEAAGVNKALLYYYFDSKEKLYRAALERLSEQVRESNLQVLRSECSPGERVVRVALAHFDRVVSQQPFQKLMQQEMMRLHKGEGGGAMPILVKQTFAPMLVRYQELVCEGVAAGELIDVDWMQIHLATLGANVMYFVSAPVWRMAEMGEPLDATALANRRKRMVEFLGQTLFVDRVHGAEVAARVLATTSMPEFQGKEFFHGVRNECKE
jgi:TetR/AcrR family transcriptional regulator